MLRIVTFSALVIAVLGNTADPGQFPHHASLRSAGNAHFCAGILANNRWIVSAAHCTAGRTVDNTIVVLGALSRITGGTRYNTLRIATHPSHNPNTIAFDVSVVQTADQIIFTDLIQPIALGSVFVGGGVSAQVSGWVGGANTLQFVHVITLTNDECTERVGGQGHLIFNHKICSVVDNLVDQGGLCIIESGGAMVAANQAIAIGSWGIPSCHRDFAHIFDRISSHRNWIVSNF